VGFSELFTAEEGRAGAVVSFVAVLELVKSQLITLTQNEPFSPIYVSVASGADATVAQETDYDA
jgi:segregation and condensation protein A